MNNLYHSFENLDPDIKKHRTTTAAVRIVNEDNTPLSEQEVVITQKNHRFLSFYRVYYRLGRSDAPEDRGSQ